MTRGLIVSRYAGADSLLEIVSFVCAKVLPATDHSRQPSQATARVPGTAMSRFG
jgi:hypothetical protein